MKKILMSVLLYVISLCANNAIAIPLLSLELVTPTGTTSSSIPKIHAGEFITYDVVLSGWDATRDQTNGGLLGAFDISIAWTNPAALDFKSASFFDHLGDPDPVAFQAVTFIDAPSSNVVRLGEVSLLEGHPDTCFFCLDPLVDDPLLYDLQSDSNGLLLDEIALARVVFEGLSANPNPIEIGFQRPSLVFSDDMGEQILTWDVDPLFSKLEVDSNVSVVVPEPKTIFVFGLGLIGMYVCLRRRCV